MRRNRVPIVRLFLFLALFVLPLLALGGSNSAQAANKVPPGPPPIFGGSGTDRILVLRVYYRSKDELNSLAQEFGVESPPVNGYITVWADQASLDSLKARGLRVELDADATRQANEPVVWGHNANTFFNGYYTVEEMSAFLDAKAAAYPNLAEKVDFGDSWCKAHPGQCTLPNSYNGYDMMAMHITNRNIPGPKGVFWYNAGLHAREIVPPELAMLYISWLLDGYDSNPDARWLVDYQDIWIVPMSNPDGHHIAENGASTPRTQRKNANNTNGCTTWPPSGGSQFGTDLNRNFIFMWACCNGSSPFPCDLTYRGPTPVSENETLAISNTVASLIPDQRGPNINDPAPLTAMGVFLDMHSQARLDLYPWGQQYDPSPNDADLHNIASHFGALNANPPGNGYTVQQSVGLYPTDGASDDSTYGMLGAAGFTIELNSGGSFTPQYSVVNTDWNANRGALIYLSKIARAPYLTTRGPDSSMVATNPMTVTQGTPSTLSGTMNYSWTGNFYLQNVAGAEYYIDSSPWTGGTPIAMAATDGNFDSPTEAVQATVDTSSLAPGRHLLLVRGRGINDYEGNHSWGPISAAFLDVLPGGGGTPTPTGTPTPLPGTNFCNPEKFFIPEVGTATPYPSNMVVQGLTGTVNYVSVFLNGILSDRPDDLDILLVGPQGQSVVLMSDAAGTCPHLPYNTTFADGPPQMPDESCPPAGQYIFSLSNYGENPDNFPAPAPTPPYGATMSVFNGTDPNGTWKLYVVDDTPGINDYIFGWCLRISTTSGTVTATPTSPATSISTSTPTRTATPPGATNTPTSTTPLPTATPCPVQFTDVPPGSTFYPYIHCLACMRIVNGYSDGTFRPNNNATRGQTLKILCLLRSCESEPQTEQTFQDVPVGSTFYHFIQYFANRGVVSGYSCGGPGEPCVPPENRPYFRPNGTTTRGQLTKVDALSAGFSDPPVGQTFEDVLPGSTFYTYTEQLASRGIMSGYPCGGAGEPCIPPGSRPYFRPGNNVTRGQTAKIEVNTFFPGCNEATHVAR